MRESKTSEKVVLDGSYIFLKKLRNKTKGGKITRKSKMPGIAQMNVVLQTQMHQSTRTEVIESVHNDYCVNQSVWAFTCNRNSSSIKLRFKMSDSVEFKEFNIN